MQNIILLRKIFSAHSKQSGYDRLFDILAKELSNAICINDIQGRTGRYLPTTPFDILRKKYWYGTSFYKSKESVISEFKAITKAYKTKSELIHYGYFEDHFGIIRYDNFRKLVKKTKIMATVHCPSSWWKLYGNPNMVKGLDAMIVLSESELDYFDQYLSGKVFYVPHGINVDYFTPDHPQRDERFRCIFVGQWLRDIETMVAVAERIISMKNADIHFDIVYPQWRRQNKDYLYRVVNHKNVNFHHNLSDDQLKALYQKASVLLLPLFDCTANNAVLEGIACGLPVISNDVPGIQSYVNETFATLHPVGDVDSMVDTVLHAYNNRDALLAKGEAARKHACKYDWATISDRVIEIYDNLLEKPIPRGKK